MIFVGALLAATTGVVAASRDLDGPHLAADHAALRLRPARRDRRDRGLGHARADHPAVARADRHGRPARPLGRRHVRRAPSSPASCSPACTPATSCCSRSSSPRGSRRCPPRRARSASRTARPGTRSLAVLTLVSVLAGIALLAAVLQSGIAPETPIDVRIVVSTSVGGRRRVRCRGRSTRCSRLGLLSRLAERVTFVLIPPLALIFLVLGTIFLGVATPTEGGAMGAVGALLMAIARRRLSFSLLHAGDGQHRQAHRLRDLHPDRRARLQPHVLRASTATSGSSTCCSTCPAGRSAS